MRQTHCQKQDADLSTVAGLRSLSWLTERIRCMTAEELEELLEKQNQQLADLEAEVNSLKEENAKLISEAAERSDELKKTKQMNFTLARQVDRIPAKSDEEILNEMF